MSVRKIDKKDVVKDIIFFFLYTLLAFGYTILLLLIISFMFVSVLPLKYKHMLILSGIAAGIAAIVYVVKMIKKYNPAA